MTKNLIFILALTGCSGEAFTAGVGDPAATDDGGLDSKIAAGGSEDDGGVLPTGSGGAGGTVGVMGAGGAPVAAGGSGSAVGSGGAPVATGGSSTGGSRATGGNVGAGGVTSAGGTTSTGGTAATGGSTSAGGAVTCTLVTHDNGLGQTWQDCVPLGTYNESQATKACKASGAIACNPTAACTSNAPIVCGYGPNPVVFGCWGYAGDAVGLAKANDNCSAFTVTWR